MAESKFEKELFLQRDCSGGEFKDGTEGYAPILLQIENGKITISARVHQGRQPELSSLKLIRDIDKFLHKTTIHIHCPTTECDHPEKIVFFLRLT